MIKHHYEDRAPWESEYISDFEKLERARKEVPHWESNMPNPKHPSHVQPRPESIIDPNFKVSRQSKIKALVGLGISMNLLGKTFKLKQQYIYCTHYLEKEGVKFEVVFDNEENAPVKIEIH